MFRIRMLLAAALTAAVVSVSAPATADAGQRRQMIRAINFVRSWSHRHSLNYSRRLSARAGAWARHLMSNGVLAHSGLAQGEIIEWHSGHRGMVNRTAIEWLHSASHRHVMLGRRYHRAGAGKAVGYMNGRRSVVWVVQFSR